VQAHIEKDQKGSILALAEKKAVENSQETAVVGGRGIKRESAEGE